VAYRLYLLKDWATDRARRRKTGVPDDNSFMTKREIALVRSVGRARPGSRAAWF